MVRRKVEFIQGGYYHIYNRGCNRELIFRCDENYYFLLRRVKREITPWQVTIIAYTLMPNHYHFLARQDGSQSLSYFVQAVFNSYTKAFNRMYDRHGTLFEGPFQAIPVTKEEYLIHLCRYIHRNPLEAGLVADLTAWPFSNYLEWIGKREGRLVDQDFARAWFPTSAAYEQFVLDYTPPQAIAEAVRRLALE